MHRSIGATFLDAFTGTFRARAALPSVLYVLAFALLAAGLVAAREDTWVAKGLLTSALVVVFMGLAVDR